MGVMDSKMYEARTLEHWRAWLRKHYASESEVWLVFNKLHTGRRSIDYKDALDEALCFGWVDSLIKRLDDARYARKFTPRKPDSKWSAINRKRYAELKAEGRLHAAGIERPPTDRVAERPTVPRFPTVLPYIQKALERHPKAWRTLQSLSPRERERYVRWIDIAKQDATKARRLKEAIRLLSAGQKLGLK
jgi:uncharacterized protein YdeI (YjbR/CyaY-like superfamily)